MVYGCLAEWEWLEERIRKVWSGLGFRFLLRSFLLGIPWQSSG